MHGFWNTIAWIIDLVFDLAMLAVFVRALVSWFSPDPYNELYRFLVRVTEPLLRPVRRLLPATGGVDLSPLVVLLVLMVLQRALVSALRGFAY